MNAKKTAVKSAVKVKPEAEAKIQTKPKAERVTSKSKAAELTSPWNKKYEMLTSSHCTITFEENGRTITLYRIKLLKTISVSGKLFEKGSIGGWIESEACLSFREDDNSWISDYARVYGNSQVSGNARVTDNATVKNRSSVCDRACVRNGAVVNNSRIHGNATVQGMSTVIGVHMTGESRVEDNAVIVGPVNLSGTATFSQNARVDGGMTDLRGSEISIGHFRDDTLIIDNWGFMVVANVGSENGTITISTGAKKDLVVTRGCFTGTPKEFIAASVRTHGNGTAINKEYRAILRLAEPRMKPLQKMVNEFVAEEAEEKIAAQNPVLSETAS